MMQVSTENTRSELVLSEHLRDRRPDKRITMTTH